MRALPGDFIHTREKEITQSSLFWVIAITMCGAILSNSHKSHHKYDADSENVNKIAALMFGIWTLRKVEGSLHFVSSADFWS